MTVSPRTRLTGWLARPLVLVLLLTALSSFVGLGWAPLLDWDENMQSEVAHQIALHHDILRLQLNGQPFTEKPPLFFIEMAQFFRLLGVSETTARLTSAVNGLIFVAALYGIGKRLVDQELGFAWALMYGSALLPLLLSRGAVVECTFNALMGLSALLLLLYDEALGAYQAAGQGTPDSPRAQPARWRHWAWLLGASLALGLAVLAKGPSGGAVPLVAFAFAKLGRPRPRIQPLHVLACAALSLGVAASWYVANYLVQGAEFVQGFARFMGLLFSRPLEGHQGPIYYHLVVGAVGLFPWTPLLLLFALPGVRRGLWAQPRLRPLLTMAVGWAGFILVVFSLVQTKLPHYSSGMYVPLTLLAALALRQVRQGGGALPRWLVALWTLSALTLGAGLAALPYAARWIAAAEGPALREPPVPAPGAFLPGVLIALGVAGAAWLMGRHQTRRGLVLAASAMGLFVITAWRVILPLVEAYNQGPVLALMREAYAHEGRLAMVDTVSYAVLFYGGRPVNMIGTYKFAGDPAALDRPGSTPLYVIAPVSKGAALVREHPRLQPVREEGDLGLWVLPAAGG